VKDLNLADKDFQSPLYLLSYTSNFNDEFFAFINIKAKNSSLKLTNP
jgi:hypothetical protein